MMELFLFVAFIAYIPMTISLYFDPVYRAITPNYPLTSAIFWPVVLTWHMIKEIKK